MATYVPVQPCVDDRCPVHARGADPASASALTCARQVLRAYDRADAIALLEQEPPLPDLGAERVILPLYSPPLAAGQSGEARYVEASPPRPGRQVYRFRADRLILRGNGSWRVDDVVLAGRSQVAPHGRLPSELFANHVAGAGVRVFDRIARPLDASLAVTRLGGAEPEALVGAFLGWATYEPRVLSLRSTARVRPGSSVQVDGDCTEPVEALRLVVEAGSDWVVHDVCVDGASVFVQKGDIPGEMFSSSTIDGFVRLGVVRAGSRVSIHATYVGYDLEGGSLVGELRGQEPHLESASASGSAPG